MLRKKRFDASRITLSEFAQGPGEGLLHHLMPVRYEHPADPERATGITLTSASLGIQRNRTNKRGPPPAPVIGLCPPPNQPVVDATSAPSRARNDTSKRIDISPVANPISKFLHLVRRQGLHRDFVVQHELAGDEARDSSFDKAMCKREDLGAAFCEGHFGDCLSQIPQTGRV